MGKVISLCVLISALLFEYFKAVFDIVLVINCCLVMLSHINLLFIIGINFSQIRLDSFFS